MTSQLLSSLRKGTPPEAALAVRALGLHLLTLGLGPELDRLASLPLHNLHPSSLDQVSALPELTAANGDIGKTYKSRCQSQDVTGLQSKVILSCTFSLYGTVADIPWQTFSSSSYLLAASKGCRSLPS